MLAFLKKLMKSNRLVFTIYFILFKSWIINSSQELDHKDWQKILTGHWIVKFYASWCPSCKALEEPWKQLSALSKDFGIHVGEVDITENPELSGRFLVTTIPTIIHVKDGVFRVANGLHNEEKLIHFLENREWAKIEPIPLWKNPSSFHMGLLGEFFKFSMLLKDIHNHLVFEYGLPTWVSYGLFILSTIIIGALMGVLLVFLIEYMQDSKHKPSHIISTKIAYPRGGGDLEDDLIGEPICQEDIDNVEKILESIPHSESDIPKQNDTTKKEN